MCRVDVPWSSTLTGWVWYLLILAILSWKAKDSSVSKWEASTYDSSEVIFRTLIITLGFFVSLMYYVSNLWYILIKVNTLREGGESLQEMPFIVLFGATTSVPSTSLILYLHPWKWQTGCTFFTVLNCHVPPAESLPTHGKHFL